MIEEGRKAPDFTLPSYGGEEVSLADFRGKNVVLYFYPKDMTPGCTVEACDFTERRRRFDARDTVILGVSRDSVTRHEKFRDKHSLSFPLLADEDGGVCEAYGVWQEKSLYGRKFMGIVRATFLIGPDGVVRKVWPKVKVAGHADELLAEVGGKPMGGTAKKAAKKTTKKTGRAKK